MTARVLGLTRQQAEALRFIGAYFARHGHAPEHAEICVGVGMSPASKSAMHYRIRRLRERGYITAQFHTQRSIALTAAGLLYCKQFPGWRYNARFRSGYPEGAGA